MTVCKDPRLNPFLEFFSGLGATFVDADTGERLIDETPTLCENCWCVTKTNRMDGTCLKCGARKENYDKQNSKK